MARSRPEQLRGAFARVLATAVALGCIAASCANTHERPPVRFPPNASPSVILDAEGRVITTIAEENRTAIAIADIPVRMQQAIVAIEDTEFWEHNGINPRAILRAADANAGAGEVSQGGSTITQQYVKNALLGDDRTIARKVEEATMAMALERAYSKEVILEQYLNTIYFGAGAYGIEAAAQEFFGVPTQDLTLPQAALLAGTVQSPARWDPREHPEDALARRNLVLQRMRDEGYISPEQAEAATEEPLGVVDREQQLASTARYPAAHFVEEVKHWLLTESDALGEHQAERYDALLRGGLTITTTIDLDLQAQAEAAIAQVLPGQGTDPRMPDAALTSIEPSTGEIKAMVGGRDFWGSHSYAKLNLAEGAGRSTGSAFKPIALATALSNGVPPGTRFDAPSSASFPIPGGTWNVKGGGIGSGTMAECTVVSSNTCYANIILDDRVGAEDTVEMARRLGITQTELDAVPAAVLGANNATVRDMAAVYATFSNGGIHVPPVYVTKVERSDGTVLYQHAHEQTKVLEPEVARQVNDILPGVISAPGGTGRRAAIDRPAGGKTGSAQNNTDAWFCGYTPQLATAVWVGFSETRAQSDGRERLVSMVPGNTPITVYGGTYPARIWAAFMGPALEDQPALPLNPPVPPPTTTTTEPEPPAILEAPLPPEQRRTTEVPAVVGLVEAEARSALRAAGFAVEVVPVTAAADDPPGRVVAQAPAGADSTFSGDTVWIEVTEGAPASRTPVPDVTGLPAAEAAAQLRRLYFEVSTRDSEPPAGTVDPDGNPYPAGTAWRTTPGTGELAPDGAVVIDVVAPQAPTNSTTTTTSPPG
ncbi:MAG: transglycosylase domain-containing protein [Microthrixaceae bacterium]|nr:transglycosylase domain-containing protein [Microthrixaceae bacterium]